MTEKKGRQTVLLYNRPKIISSAGVVGKKEGEGPLGKEFDRVFTDGRMNESSWEKAESALQKAAIDTALQKAKLEPEDADMLFAGDLLGQSIGTTFGVRSLGIPFAGLYGACSTMALSLGLAGIFVNSGAANRAVAATSSHFCSAERQFRLPLEYGGQRPPQAQWTATAAGAAIIEADGHGPTIESMTFGRIRDYGVTDANNMGAAMAPAAADTISALLNETGQTAADFDLFVTGDLGAIGSKLLVDLLKEEHKIDLGSKHKDCGTMIYRIDEQDVNSGGSGCGCSASVICTHFMKKLLSGEIKRMVFIGTGALMSTVSSQQGESIPTVAHAVVLRGCD